MKQVRGEKFNINSNCYNVLGENRKSTMHTYNQKAYFEVVMVH